MLFLLEFFLSNNNYRGFRFFFHDCRLDTDRLIAG